MMGHTPSLYDAYTETLETSFQSAIESTLAGATSADTAQTETHDRARD
jgi:hypothetical protein